MDRKRLFSPARRQRHSPKPGMDSSGGLWARRSPCAISTGDWKAWHYQKDGREAADIVITSSMDRRELLPGADFVVVTIAAAVAWEDVIILASTASISLWAFHHAGHHRPAHDPAMIDIARDATRQFCAFSATAIP